MSSQRCVKFVYPLVYWTLPILGFLEFGNLVVSTTIYVARGDSRDDSYLCVKYFWCRNYLWRKLRWGTWTFLISNIVKLQTLSISIVFNNFNHSKISGSLCHFIKEFCISDFFKGVFKYYISWIVLKTLLPTSPHHSEAKRLLYMALSPLYFFGNPASPRKLY